MKNNISRIFKISVVLFVIGIIAIGLYFVGSPQQARMKKFDKQKISDLQRLSHFIDGYYRENEKLPDKLEELKQNKPNLSITDPQTNRKYQYEKIKNRQYKLCAEFNNSQTESKRYYPTPRREEKWNYQQGESCFELKVRDVG
ncbi:MAG: hypothetical protein BRC22_02315, partial [Parcubacteria group bacterium QH_9_35_7]